MSQASYIIWGFLKKGLLIVLIIAGCIFGNQIYQKNKAKKNLIIALTANVSESAAYEQFYIDTAKQNLFKTMFHIHAGVELKMTPEELLDQAMRKDTEELFSAEDPEELTPRKALIYDAVLSNYSNCLKLGIFDIESNLKALEEGEAPTITNGPAEGKNAAIINLIPKAAFEGAHKMLPNMVISPPLPKKMTASDFHLHMARGKSFLKELRYASIVERSAYQKVIDYYDKKTSLQR